jgi:hypothetical protein
MPLISKTKIYHKLQTSSIGIVQQGQEVISSMFFKSFQKINNCKANVFENEKQTLFEKSFRIYIIIHRAIVSSKQIEIRLNKRVFTRSMQKNTIIFKFKKLCFDIYHLIIIIIILLNNLYLVLIHKHVE